MENTVVIKLSQNNEMTICRHIMSDIKIGDFWAWLNRYIPAFEVLRLLDICECDYKRLMIRKYNRIFNTKN